MADLVLFPHCDLHVALTGTPQLRIALHTRAPANPPANLVLTDVTSACAYDFFAPHNAPGNRYQEFVNIDAAGLVTPVAAGTNLVQIRHGDDYIIARIQVHANVLGWWFGNASITTAVDPRFAHAQPSIYALFSDDPQGTDRVGDITGHGYVALTSANPGMFTVAANGRLQGVAEGSGSLTGTFLAVSHQLPVRVVSYNKVRNVLDGVRVHDLANAAEMHNILFLAEGFRDRADDRELFDEVVTKTVDQLFSKPRHSPYPMLEGGFNIWKAYEPSTQHGLTCGFRLNDQPGGASLESGHPIPHESQVGSDPGVAYTVSELVRRVGLPRSNETRDAAALIAEWNGQTLHDFVPARVNAALVEAWKAQRSGGLLEARDTIFGMYLGARLGDRPSGSGPVPRPPAETAGSAPLRAFVRRVYEWFAAPLQSRLITPDPRRHPPEILSRFWWPHNNAILKYIGALHWRFGTHPNIGIEWVPDVVLIPTRLQPSLALVAIVVNDAGVGGARFTFATSMTLGKDTRYGFDLTTTGNERPMRRTPADTIDADVQEIIDTIAHEFGHSFNLNDEYEEFGGDDPGFNERPDQDVHYDNTARLAAVYLHGAIQPDGTIVFADRLIDADKVKWLELLRPQLSDRLVAPSREVGGSLEVTIDRRFAGAWTAAKKQNLEAYLRARRIEPSGQQLPLRHGDADYLVRLLIERVDEATGTVVLGGPELPPSPIPVFPKDSLLFVPRRNAAGDLVFVAERKVRQKLDADGLVLNQDPNTAQINTDRDDPVDVPQLKGPCKSYKLIGVYEGGGGFSAGFYRPTGLCKMRRQADQEGIGEGAFCHVCKYLIVNRVNPGLLALLDKTQYPGAKKGGDV